MYTSPKMNKLVRSIKLLGMGLALLERQLNSDIPAYLTKVPLWPEYIILGLSLFSRTCRSKIESECVT